MSIAQYFGDYREDLPDSHEHLTLVFSPGSISLQERWRNNGLSADFMADYLATFFPRSKQGDSSLNSPSQIKNTVSFIANELLENAMKFSDQEGNDPISITLRLYETSLVFLSTNRINQSTANRFQSYIHTIINCDPQSLLIKQLEENVEEHSTESRLGILTLMSDYQARIGWKFESLEQSPNIQTVTVMVQLNINGES